MVILDLVLILIAGVIGYMALRVTGPLTEALVEKLRGPVGNAAVSEVKLLKQRLDSLESELLEVKGQVKTIQESSDFVSHLLESGEINAAKKLLKLKE
jgi:hypothetical protein